MYYEINVSKNGQHFFATAPRSITTMAHLQEVYPEIAKAFPARKGYNITITRKENTGFIITPDEIQRA